MIDRFGVRAVLGRDTLRAGEIRRMLYAEALIEAYRDREKSTNWATWARENEARSEMLAEAAELARLNNG
jgi:hypothetical protein